MVVASHGCRNPCQIECPPRSCRGGGRADERAGLEVVSLRAAAGGPPRTAEERPWLWTGQGFDCPRFGSAGSEWSVKRSTLKLPCQSSTPGAGRAQILPVRQFSGRNPCQQDGIRRQDMSSLRCRGRAHKSDFSSTPRTNSLTCRGSRVSGARCAFVIPSNLTFLSRTTTSTACRHPESGGGSDSVLRIGARTGSHSLGLGGLEVSNRRDRLVEVGLGPRGLVVRGFNTRAAQ